MLKSNTSGREQPSVTGIQKNVKIRTNFGVDFWPQLEGSDSSVPYCCFTLQKVIPHFLLWENNRCTGECFPIWNKEISLKDE